MAAGPYRRGRISYRRSVGVVTLHVVIQTDLTRGEEPGGTSGDQKLWGEHVDGVVDEAVRRVVGIRHHHLEVVPISILPDTVEVPLHDTESEIIVDELLDHVADPDVGRAIGRRPTVGCPRA